MEDHQLAESEEVSPININEEIQYYLYETAKWAKFLSIVGFVFTGFMLLAAFTIKSVLSASGNASPVAGMPGGTSIIAGIYLITAVLYFFPTLYLYKFSSNTKQGINYSNQEQLTQAFSNLKSVYKFWGILTLTIIIFYTLLLIAIAAGGYTFMDAMQHSA